MRKVGISLVVDCGVGKQEDRMSEEGKIELGGRED